MSITRYVGTLSVVIALLACTRALASQNASQEPGREQLKVFTSDSEPAVRLRALPVSEQKLLGDRLHDRFASTPELLQSLSHGEARGLARVLRLLGDYRGWNLYVDWCSLQEAPAFLDDPHVLSQIAVDLEMLNYLAYTAPASTVDFVARLRARLAERTLENPEAVKRVSLEDWLGLTRHLSIPDHRKSHWHWKLSSAFNKENPDFGEQIQIWSFSRSFGAHVPADIDASIAANEEALAAMDLRTLQALSSLLPRGQRYLPLRTMIIDSLRERLQNGDALPRSIDFARFQIILRECGLKDHPRKDEWRHLLLRRYVHDDEVFRRLDSDELYRLHALLSLAGEDAPNAILARWVTESDKLSGYVRPITYEWLLRRLREEKSREAMAAKQVVLEAIQKDYLVTSQHTLGDQPWIEMSILLHLVAAQDPKTTQLASQIQAELLSSEVWKRSDSLQLASAIVQLRPHPKDKDDPFKALRQKLADEVVGSLLNDPERGLAEHHRVLERVVHDVSRTVRGTIRNQLLKTAGDPVYLIELEWKQAQQYVDNMLAVLEASGAGAGEVEALGLRHTLYWYHEESLPPRVTLEANTRIYKNYEDIWWGFHHYGRKQCDPVTARKLRESLSDQREVHGFAVIVLSWFYHSKSPHGSVEEYRAWKAYLDDRLGAEGLSADEKAGWLLARAYAEEVEREHPIPLAGGSFIEEALTTAERESLRLDALRWLVQREASVNHTADANALLRSLEQQFESPESKQRIADLGQQVSAAAQGEQMRQAANSATANQARRRDFEERLRQAEAQNDQRAIARYRTLLEQME